jgi:hypothetical protein
VYRLKEEHEPMVSGQYVRRFEDASHVLFNGHMDNPSFREIAIQEIIDVKKSVVVIRSGSLKIRRKPDEAESVTLTYTDIFGKQAAKGFPFKDEHTPAWSEREPVEGSIT